jgi:ATPase involved in DNA replication initiation
MPSNPPFDAQQASGTSLPAAGCGVLRGLLAETLPAGEGERNDQPRPRPLPATQVPLPVSLVADRASDRQMRKWRHSFDDFVIGPSNELAHAASRSICGEMQGCELLFLNSAPGLGKTHLMQSVGNYLCTCCNRKLPRVEYLTAEEFTSQFFLALNQKETDKFKHRFRDIDLLLLEDVHFLQGKAKTQDELLGSLKAIDARGGKVVFTSSFAAAELRNMDEQLHSRLCSGLLAPITRPDEETRKRIFYQKARAFQVHLPEEVEDTLARHIRSDVRQIESCLRNLVLKARLLNCGISLQMAWEVIAQYVNHAPVLDFEGIVSFVCKGFGLSKEQLCSNSRKQEYVMARNSAFFLARKHTDLSLEAIGQQFNRRHSTVLKGITNIEREMGRQTPAGRQLTRVLGMIEKNGSILPPTP